MNVLFNTAKKRKLRVASLYPDLLLEDRQAPTEDVKALGACANAAQQEQFVYMLPVRTDARSDLSCCGWWGWQVKGCIAQQYKSIIKCQHEFLFLLLSV